MNWYMESVYGEMIVEAIEKVKKYVGVA